MANIKFTEEIIDLFNAIGLDEYIKNHQSYIVRNDGILIVKK